MIAGESNFGPTPNGQRGAMLRVRQDDRLRGRRRLHAGATKRQSDDLHGQQHAVLVVAIGGAGHPGELLVLKAGS